MPELFDSNTPILEAHIPVIAMVCCVLFIGIRMPMGIPRCVGSVGLFDWCINARTNITHLPLPAPRLAFSRSSTSQADVREPSASVSELACHSPQVRSVLHISSSRVDGARLLPFEVSPPHPQRGWDMQPHSNLINTHHPPPFCVQWCPHHPKTRYQPLPHQ